MRFPRPFMPARWQKGREVLLLQVGLVGSITWSPTRHGVTVYCDLNTPVSLPACTYWSNHRSRTASRTQCQLTDAPSIAVGPDADENGTAQMYWKWDM